MELKTFGTYVLFPAILILGLTLYFYGSPRSREDAENSARKTRPPELTYHFPPGQKLSYRIRYKKESSADISRLRNSSSRNPRYGTSTSLKGTWVVKGYPSNSEDSYLLGWQIKNPSLDLSSSRKTAPAPEIKQKLTNQLKKEVYLKLSKRGRPEQFYFPPELHSPVEGLWQEWANVAMVVFPSETTREQSRNNSPDSVSWTTQRKELQGMYEAKLVRTSRKNIEKRIQQYRSVPNQISLSPGTEINGTDRYEWDPTKNILTSASGTVKRNGFLLGKGQKGRLSSTRTFSMELTEHQKPGDRSSKSSRQNKDLQNILNNQVIRDIGQRSPSYRSPEESIDFTSLQKTVHQYVRNPETIPRNQNVLGTMVSFIHQNPEKATRKIKNTIENKDAPPKVRVAWLNVLAMSQNVAAHRLLASTIRTHRNQLGKHALRTMLWNIKTPSEELLDAVTSALDSGAGNTDYFQESMRATGALVSHLNPLSIRGNELFTKLRKQGERAQSREDKIAYLDALGNSHHRQAFSEITQILNGNEGEKVKEAAARALQSVPKPKKVTNFLLKYIRETGSNIIRRTAVKSLVHIHLNTPSAPKKEQTRSLLKQLVRTHENKFVRKEAFEYFSEQNLRDDVEARKLLKFVRENDPDHNLRKKAKKILRKWKASNKGSTDSSGKEKKEQ